jgi:glyoxylase-like metal-dependent hydrolase (beta-lactamase superfamily II)
MRRRGIAAFDKAEWWITEREREASQASLRESLEQAEEAEDRDLIRLVESEMAVLARCRDCEDRLVEGVDLYPMYGVTPGSAGLLVLDASSATLVCGDAIPTLEHLAQGKVFSPCWDLEAAQESFREALEVADVLVLGRDGMIVNPVRRLM